MLVLRVFGLLGGLGAGIGKARLGDLQRFQHLFGAADDPHRLAAPLDDLEVARRDLGEIDLDRRAGGLGALGRQHAGDEGDRRPEAGDAAGDRSGDHEVAPRLVWFFLIVHRDGMVMVGRESVRF
jgi:hypothetical protein